MTTETTTAMPPVATREEWLAKRKELLAEEKELTKHDDRVNAMRRRLPMVKLDKTYEFDSPEGKITLLDLFEDKRQLLVYHFMFDPAWEEGCPGCTGFADALGDLSMLGERNTAFAMISRAPLEKLEKYKAEKGWKERWVSSFGSDFNYDFHVTLDEAKAPMEYNYKDKEQLLKNSRSGDITGEYHGMSVFFRDGEDLYHTYSSYARGTENLTNSYELLDVTPYGRQEDFEDSPEGWPQKPTYG